jgi:hypothetical protein
MIVTKVDQKGAKWSNKASLQGKITSEDTRSPLLPGS